MIPLPMVLAALLLLGGLGFAASHLWAPARRDELSGLGLPSAGLPSRESPLLRSDPAPLLSVLLRRFGLWERIQWQMIRAGLLLLPSEVAAVSLATGLMGWLFGNFVLRSPLLGLVCAAAGLAAPWLAIGARRQARLRKLTRQLPPALGMLSSSLRSGYSLLRAMDVVATEMGPPVSEEFRRVVDESTVGYSLDQSLSNLVARTQSSDVKLLVTAMQIQQQVGGNLASILDTTAAMIRERFNLAAEIGALTAEGRMSTMVLAGLPIGVALAIHAVSPGYLAPLWTDPLGRMMLAGGACMLISGVLIVKRMMDVNL